jgi:hypothetical protein
MNTINWEKKAYQTKNIVKKKYERSYSIIRFN